MATWKPFGVVLLLSACAFAQIPAGGTCAAATPVFDGVNPGAPSGTHGLWFTNAGATPGPGALADVWFSYTATGSGTVTVATCDPAGLPPGTAAVRALEVYAACGGVPLMTAERVCGNGAATSFVAAAGQAYLVRVYNEINAALIPPGTFYVTIAYDGPAQTGTCAGAPALPTIPFGVDFDPIPATGDASPTTCVPAGSGTGFSQAWFAIAPGGARTLGVRSSNVASPLSGAGSFVDPQTIAVFDVSAGCASPTAVACATGGYLQCALSAGASYAVRVTFVAPLASGRRAIVSAHLGAPFQGDVCASATPLELTPVNDLVFAYPDFLGATAETGASGNLCAAGPVGIDYWRTLTLPFDCLVSLTWVATLAGTNVSVFPAGCAAGPPLVCHTASFIATSTASFTGFAGQTYVFRFAVSSLAAGPPPAALVINCNPTPTGYPIPSNDDCAGALAVPFGPFSGTVLGATPSSPFLASTCGSSFADDPDVWLSFTATTSATHLLVATVGDPTNPNPPAVGCEVFTACGGTSLACAAPGPGASSSTWTTLTTVAGATYLLRIFADSAIYPNRTYSLQFLPSSPNDGATDAIELFDGLNPAPPAGQPGQFYATPNATNSPVAGVLCPGSTTPAAMSSVDVWFRYTAASGEPRVVSLCTPPGFPAPPGADLALRVHDGFPSMNTLIACADDDCALLPRATFSPVPGATYYVVVEQKGVTTPWTANAGFYVRVDLPASQGPAGAGCTSFAPPLTASAPNLGGTPSLTLTAVGGDSAWIYGSADADGSTDLGFLQPGCVLHLDPTTTFAAAPVAFAGPFPFPTPSSVYFPNLPAWLVGFSLRFQAVVVPGPNSFNTQHPALFRLSNAVRVTFGY